LRELKKERKTRNGATSIVFVQCDSTSLRLSGMEGMAKATLGPGGFAVMPSKAIHWFTCKSKNTCLMFVTFGRMYDIVWAKQAR
jgi:hypothetical protein